MISAVIAFAGPLGLTHLHIPQLEDTKLWNDGAIRELDLPAALLAINFFSIEFIVVFGLFFLIVEFFAILGGRLGTLFDTLSATRAYGVNLAASLAGIWLFALRCWTSSNGTTCRTTSRSPAGCSSWARGWATTWRRRCAMAPNTWTPWR